MNLLTSNPTTKTNPDFILKELIDDKSSTKIKAYIDIKNLFNQIINLYDQELFQEINDKFIYYKELPPVFNYFPMVSDFYDNLVNETKFTYITNSDIKLKQWRSTTSIILFNVNKRVVLELKEIEHITCIASVFEDNVINYHIYHNYEKISRETLDHLLDIEISILNNFPSQTIDFYYIDQETFNPNNYIAQNKHVIFNRNND